MAAKRAKTTKKAVKRTVKASTKKTAKKAAGKSPKQAASAPRKASKARAPKPAAPASNPGMIAHTEFASADPAATRAWAQKTLGWKFAPPMPMPDGEYHMWNVGMDTSGGLRAAMAPEQPGTIVYVEVADIKRGYEKALANGAKEMLPPMAIPPDMGWMAIVNAPGGVVIGLWSMK